MKKSTFAVLICLFILSIFTNCNPIPVPTVGFTPTCLYDTDCPKELFCYHSVCILGKRTEKKNETISTEYVSDSKGEPISEILSEIPKESIEKQNERQNEIASEQNTENILTEPMTDSNREPVTDKHSPDNADGGNIEIPTEENLKEHTEPPDTSKETQTEPVPDITPEPDKPSCSCRNSDYVCINGKCEPKSCSGISDCLATCQYDPGRMQKICVPCSTNSICTTLTAGQRPICSGSICIKQ